MHFFEQCGLTIMVYERTRWVRFSLELQTKYWSHTNMHAGIHTFTLTQTHFKELNPLCESVSFVVVDTIGLFLFVFVCMWMCVREWDLCIHVAVMQRLMYDCAPYACTARACEKHKKVPTVCQFSIQSNLFPIPVLGVCVSTQKCVSGRLWLVESLGLIKTMSWLKLMQYITETHCGTHTSMARGVHLNTHSVALCYGPLL